MPVFSKHRLAAISDEHHGASRSPEWAADKCAASDQKGTFSKIQNSAKHAFCDRGFHIAGVGMQLFGPGRVTREPGAENREADRHPGERFDRGGDAVQPGGRLRLLQDLRGERGGVCRITCSYLCINQRRGGPARVAVP